MNCKITKKIADKRNICDFFAVVSGKNYKLTKWSDFLPIDKMPKILTY